MNKVLFRDLIKERKLRLSGPRSLIFQELSAAGEPLSPREIYYSLHKERRRIGLTSVYRVLGLFESLGIVFKVVNGSKSGYKLCELEDHHHHIICKNCGHVEELNFCFISDWSTKVTEYTGYQVTDHQLNLYGLCRECKS